MAQSQALPFYEVREGTFRAPSFPRCNDFPSTAGSLCYPTPQPKLLTLRVPQVTSGGARS